MVEAVPPRVTEARPSPALPVRRDARRAALPRRGLSMATAALVALALLAGRASATVVVAKDFAALCDEADLVFVGTVTGMESRWSDPSQQTMETLVTFGDLTWLRGTPRAAVTLRFSGGEIDGLREEIADAPHFAIGERRVIFAREGRFVSPIVGFDQGALRVVDGTDGPVVVGAGGAVLPADGAGVRAGDSAPGGALRRAAPPDADGSPVPLDEFLGRVRGQLARPSNGTP